MEQPVELTEQQFASGEGMDSLISRIFERGIVPPPLSIDSTTIDDKRIPGEIRRDSEGELYKKYITYEGFTGFLMEIFDDWFYRRLPQHISARILNIPPDRVVTFENLKWAPPRYPRGGRMVELTPQKAREESLTYGVELYIDIVLRKGSYTGPVEDRRGSVPIGLLPIMLGSSPCYLHGKTREERAAMGEDPNDPLGYFIVGGTEKVVLLQEQLRLNRIFLFLHKSKENPVCRLTVPTDRGTVLIQMAIGKKGALKLQLPSLRKNAKGRYKSVGVLQIFRLFGITDVGEMQRIISMFLQPNAARKSLWELTVSILKLSVVGDDVDYIALKMVQDQKQKTREEKEEAINQIFANDLFPHINDLPPIHKIYMLSIMIAEMLEFLAGFRKLDNRDDWGAKRLESAARMIEQLFRNLWRRMLKKVQDEADSGKIRDAVSVERNINQAIITDGLYDSFISSNWGVKGFFMKNNVAQTLKRDNVISAISHLHRIDVDILRTDKQPNIRLVQNSQYGYVCSAEVSEGENCLKTQVQLRASLSQSIPIGDLHSGDTVLALDPTTHSLESTPMYDHFTRTSTEHGKEMVTVTTINGRSLDCTADHEFLVPQGFKQAGRLTTSDTICVAYLPQIIPHEIAPVPVLTPELYRQRVMPLVHESLITKHSNELEQKDLLTLSSDDRRLPILARIMGFVLTDGWLGYRNGYPSMELSFGSEEDGKSFQADMRELGYGNRLLYYEEGTMYEKGTGREVIHHVWRLSYSSSICTLLMALEISPGKKTTQSASPLPSWVKQGSLLVKREFLAGLCGGDGGCVTATKYPKRVHAYKFCIGAFGQSKQAEYAPSLVSRFEEIRDLFTELEVEISRIGTSERHGLTKVELHFCTNEANIVKFMDRIGYRYCQYKTGKSFKVVEYLRYKLQLTNARQATKLQVLSLYDSGLKAKEISQRLALDYSVVRSITCSKARTRSLNTDGMTYTQWDEVVSVKGDCVYVPVQAVTKAAPATVSDYTTVSNAHTIVAANGIVTSNCGILKNLAAIARVSVDRSDTTVVSVLRGETGDTPRIFDLPSSQHQGKILVNGRFLGWCAAEETREFCIEMRRQRLFPIDLCVVLERDYLYIHTDTSRVIRPLLIVGKNGLLEIDNKKLRGATIPELFAAGCMEYIDAWEQHGIKLATYANDLLAYNESMRQAVDLYNQSLADVEQVKQGQRVTATVLRDGFSAEEILSLDEAETRLHHAQSVLASLQRHKPYTHCELDPSALLGVAASIIPYPEHMQAPRTTYQSGMGKQSLGIYHSNHINRFDGKTKLLAFPTRPLFEPQINELIGLNQLPQGEMVTIAFGTFTGNTQEDALVFNQRAIDAGKFRIVKYTVFKTIVRNTGDVVESLGRPILQKDEPSGRYKHIQENGLPAIGAYLQQGDCVTGKVQRVLSTGEVRNESNFLKIGDEGVVDTVRVITDDKSTVVTVKVRTTRIPIKGDKFAAMYAQKQTIGSIVSPEDMPFSEATGMTPDVIVNPHCIPSRMTMGYLMEILASKHGALRGERVNATAFRPFNLDEFRQSLRHYGFNEMGYENMISGITGKRIPCQIFVGPCFLQALKHHVQDKIQARSRGPVKAANRQPARGRARTGGLRFGEMERDAAISHGASQFLRERLCSLSDPHNAILCKTCGAFASSDYTTSQYKCRNCGERGNFGRREVPYAAILLSGILAGMGMHLRLELHSEEELAQQRRARTLQEEEREVMESLQKEVIEAQEAFEEEARELEAEEEGGDVYSVFPEEEGLDE